MNENEKILQFDRVIRHCEETLYAEVTREYNVEEQCLEWWYNETFGIQWNGLVAYKYKNKDIQFTSLLDAFETKPAYMSAKEIKDIVEKDLENLEKGYKMNGKIKNEVGLLNEFHYHNIGYLESREENGLLLYSYSEENSGSVDIAVYEPTSDKLEFSSKEKFDLYFFEIKDYDDICEEIREDVDRIKELLRED